MDEQAGRATPTPWLSRLRWWLRLQVYLGCGIFFGTAIYALAILKDKHFGGEYALIGWTLMATASILHWLLDRYDKSSRSN
jgi:hypothetical protein